MCACEGWNFVQRGWKMATYEEIKKAEKKREEAKKKEIERAFDDFKPKSPRLED